MAGAAARPILAGGHPALILRRARPLLAGAGLFLLAAALRLHDLAAIRSDPYYDAAVRSMGLSWHNFFYAAFEPGGSVAIDKPPLDLWLQVASTRALGFTTRALLLPQALAGSAAVALLYDLVRRPFGEAAGVATGLVAALLPVSVLTSRSDTMDSLMMALTVAAAWLVVRSLERGRARYLYAAALVAGLAFEVKLLEALIAVPALVLMYVVGSREPRGRLLRQMLVAAALFLAGALWWPLAVTFSAGHKPYALGSADGGVLNATFVYNGSDRLAQRTPTRHERASGLRHSPPGPLRLLDPHRSRYLELIGFALAAAAGLAALAVALSLRRGGAEPVQPGSARLRRALGWGVAAWLVPAVVLFSGVQNLHPRYLESFSPAVAAAVGVPLGLLARRPVRSPVALAVGLAVVCACLAWSGERSLALVRRGATDSGHVGALPAREVTGLAGYLGPRTRGVRFEVVADGFQRVAPLIVHDARPVLIARGTSRRSLIGIGRLRDEVAAGRVRYALMADRCGAAPLRRLRACSPVGRWLRRHSVDVSRAAHAGRRGVLFSIRSGA